METRIQQLQSDSIERRSLASQDIFGAGLDDKALYQQVAATLEAGLVGLTKDSERVDELAWHAKALGSSGDMAYMPLLERAGRSGIRHLVKHAGDAKEILIEAAAAGHPYMEWEKVTMLTEKQAEGCLLIKQQTCDTSRSADVCVEDHKTKAIEVGANAIMLLMTNSQSGALVSWLGSNTTMVANYYDCKPQAAQVNAVLVPPPAS